MTRQISPVPDMQLLEQSGQPSDLVVFSDLARAGEYALRGRGRMPAAILHVAGSPFLHDDLGSAPALLLPALSGSLARLVALRPSHRLGEPRHARRSPRAGPFPDARSDVWISPSSTNFETSPTLDRHVVGERFGGMIALADWAASPTARGGSPVFVDLHWQATALVNGDYTVFAHLVDSGGQTVAQHDGMPSLGNRPTSGWRLGEIVDDRFTLNSPRPDPGLTISRSGSTVAPNA